jgi:hypothetical protein
MKKEQINVVDTPAVGALLWLLIVEMRCFGVVRRKVVSRPRLPCLYQRSVEREGYNPV